MPEAAIPEKPIVLIYAEPLLARSMTFIRTQAEALTDFRPYYVSPYLEREGLQLPADRVVVMRRGAGALSRASVIPFKMTGLAPLYIRKLKSLGPALLHAHFGPCALRAMPLARALNIPLLVTFQGYDATVYDEYARDSKHYSHRVYVRKRKTLETGSALLIAVSDFIRHELVRQGLSPEKIITHYVGVDSELFRPDPAIPREPIILFTGRLAEKKGCEYLIRAMAQIQQTTAEGELVIIGDGPLRGDLERLAGGCLRRYRFLGFQPPQVVKQWMNRSLVFGAPSLRARCGDAEGYPNTFAEAQSMGLPVVSFDADGVREAVSHGSTGFLAPERDHDALAHYLQLLLNNKDLCNRMSAAARQYVCQHFNLTKQTFELEQIYRRVLGKFGLTSSAPAAKDRHHGRIGSLGLQRR
jgi:colanic acid/amylovoran biosynthesis glycosyltransferase